MTLQDVTNQLYRLSVDAVFDGKKRTKKDLYYAIKYRLLDKDITDFQVNLPDGTWQCFVTVFHTGKDNRKAMYDLIVPKDRAEEDYWCGKVLTELGA